MMKDVKKEYKMKIGIFGGSFNPPHKMHKSIVRSLINKGYLDKIIIVPTGDNYEKSHKLKGTDRLKMLEDMFKNMDKVEVSNYEVEGHLYTINTLNYFQKKYPKAELYFILGTDLLADFEKWYKYEEVLKKYKLLVISRNTNDYNKEILKYKKYSKNIELANVSPKIISSTMIRNEILKNGYTNKLKECLYVCTINYLKTIEIKKYWK